MTKGTLFNEAGKVMIFNKPHTMSSILKLVENGTKCEVLEGPMPTEDHYPGIYLYKIRTDKLEGYVNVKYVRLK